MGCGLSKLEQDEDPSVMRPGGRRRLVSARRRTDGSTVSSAELLRRDEPYTNDFGYCDEGATKVPEASGPCCEFKGKSRPKKEEEEELPGSPSFRFYFEESARGSTEEDDDSVIGRLDALKELRSKEANIIESLPSSEASECKSSKKDKGGRFKALTKGPVSVYGFLNAKGNSQSTSPSNLSRVNPQSTVEKTA